MDLFLDSGYEKDKLATISVLKILLCAVLSIIFLFLVNIFVYRAGLADSVLAGLCMLAVLLVLNSVFRLSMSGFWLCAGLSALALVLRVTMLDFRSGDYNSFLSIWVQYFRDNGGFRALGQPIGDYNFPYLYFMALFSYLPVDDLYLIKFLSIAGDILLALYAMKLVLHMSSDRTKAFFSFFVVMLLPTVMLNSAKWGQCDSIYVAFSLMSLYYALNNRPVLSVVFIAIAFSFKLQTIFIMPFFLVMLFTGRIKIRHLFVFPAVYLVTVLPAIIAGRSILDTVTIYFNQTGSYSSHLTLNAPSIFSFLPDNLKGTTVLSILGILAAAGVICFCLIRAFKARRVLTDRHIILFSMAMTVAIPFLLPSMHERYFYIADILSVVCFLSLPASLLLPVGVQCASMIGYDAYLSGYYTLNLKLGGMLFAAAMAYSLHAYFKAIDISLLEQSSEPDLFDEIKASAD